MAELIEIQGALLQVVPEWAAEAGLPVAVRYAVSEGQRLIRGKRGRNRSAPSMWDAFLCDMYRAATLKPRTITALDLYIANGAFPNQLIGAGRRAGKSQLTNALQRKMIDDEKRPLGLWNGRTWR